MSEPSILLTGAGGFVGQHLLPALKSAFPAARLIPTGLDGHDRLDVTDKAALAAAFAAQKPDFCIHLAALSAIGASRADPENAWAINCHGTINLGRAILAQSPATRLIFISTAEVYGASFKPGLPLPESAPLEPQNTYAATKAAAEMALCALAAEGLRVQRLRPFNHTGPGQREDFVVPAFAAQIARIEAGFSGHEMLVGNLESERDFLDITDVCAAYIATIKKFDELPNNLALNICTGHATRIAAILDKLLALTSETITIRQDPARLRPSDIPRAAGNPDAAAKLLHWRPKKSLDETLASVLSHARQSTPKP
jgi:GDP-4-dehydro-6-deoxy-D-mannose reductase